MGDSQHGFRKGRSCLTCLIFSCRKAPSWGDAHGPAYGGNKIVAHRKILLFFIEPVRVTEETSRVVVFFFREPGLRSPSRPVRALGRKSRHPQGRWKSATWKGGGDTVRNVIDPVGKSDSAYNDLYGAEDYPVVKYLRRPLYFEVELLYSRDPQAELFLENCWATYSADRTSSPKWDVVVDSCENSADGYLTIFHPVSNNVRVLFPSHLKKFEVKMFSFTSSQDALKGRVKWSVGLGIFYHNAWFGLLCKQQIFTAPKSLVICDSKLAIKPLDSLCSRRRIPGKQRFGKSSVEGGQGRNLHSLVQFVY
ncbi:ZP2 protein, partial [Polyodon spathula]|nr:ZP2 protein [Polyodon spathula]